MSELTDPVGSLPQQCVSPQDCPHCPPAGSATWPVWSTGQKDRESLCQRAAEASLRGSLQVLHLSGALQSMAQMKVSVSGSYCKSRSVCHDERTQRLQELRAVSNVLVVAWTYSGSSSFSSSRMLGSLQRTPGH